MRPLSVASGLDFPASIATKHIPDAFLLKVFEMEITHITYRPY